MGQKFNVAGGSQGIWQRQSLASGLLGMTTAVAAPADDRFIYLAYEKLLAMTSFAAGAVVAEWFLPAIADAAGYGKYAFTA